ncbi:MAG TPA: ABC transporter ATP-binding protein [Oscillospiraceae bacterium]|nr:ABC transporter ATP-binding protein [Oscillospiraceae bacterium]
MDRPSAIELRHITKRFGSVVANDDVSLCVHRGEILSLLGENGSGKTTLMNMLSGIYYPDEGEILVNGESVVIHSPADAFRLGIGMIHQHFKLVDVLTAAENIVLGLPEKGKFDRKAIAARIAGISGRYGFELDPARKIYDMAVSEKQTVEIVKVLYRGADILILDEPTAVLTPQETEKLFSVLRNMKADGKAIVIITHKLGEVMEISDRVAVLRRGRYIGAVRTAETSPQELTDMMVGRAVSLDIERPEPKDPARRLCVENLSCLNGEGLKALSGVSFEVRSGEILGVAGIAGSGQKELCEAIAGLQPVTAGRILYFPPAKNDGAPQRGAAVDAAEYSERSEEFPQGGFSSPEDEKIKGAPARARESGPRGENLVGKTPLSIRKLGVSLAFVPEDRLGMGLVGDMGMVDNMMLKSYARGKSFFTDRRPSRKLAEDIVEKLEVSTPGVTTPVRQLSGGNVQKVLVGREIASAPTVLMAAYPVRGLDINSSYTIYGLLNEQKRRGVAVIYVGEDLDVLLELCDRILVLCGGRVSGIVDGRTGTKERLGLLMTQLPQEGGGTDA